MLLFLFWPSVDASECARAATWRQLQYGGKLLQSCCCRLPIHCKSRDFLDCLSNCKSGMIAIASQVTCARDVKPSQASQTVGLLSPVQTCRCFQQGLTVQLLTPPDRSSIHKQAEGFCKQAGGQPQDLHKCAPDGIRAPHSLQQGSLHDSGHVLDQMRFLIEALDLCSLTGVL